jgi:hypothetical protein
MPPSADNHREIFVAGDLREVVHYVAMPYSQGKYISMCVYAYILMS